MPTKLCRKDAYTYAFSAHTAVGESIMTMAGYAWSGNITQRLQLHILCQRSLLSPAVVLTDIDKYMHLFS